MAHFLEELDKKELPESLIEKLNKDIEEINTVEYPERELTKKIRRKQMNMVRLVEKELKIVPKNYYRNLWMILGMSIFGLPIGMAFSSAINNMGMLGIGLPVGMAMGVAMGMAMDKKALREGRQLDIEIKY